MAEVKFQTLEETPIGALSKKLLRKWQSLLRRRKLLEARKSTLDSEITAFFETLEESTPDPSEVDAQHGFRLGEDGVIYAVHCGCPGCQAGIQGLRVTTVVEAMIRQGVLKGDEATQARRNAAQIDAQAAGVEAKKKQVMLN